MSDTPTNEPTSCPRVKKKWFYREIRLADTGSGDDLVYEVEYDAIPRIAELKALVKSAYLEGHKKAAYDGEYWGTDAEIAEEGELDWRASKAARELGATLKAKDTR